MIKLQIIGHLGKDCTTNNVGGKQVINFSVAHSESYTKDGQKVEKTTWVECAYWSESKIAPYLLKGTQVYVEGAPEVRQWTGADGKQGASLSLRVFTVQLLGSKGQSAQNPPSNQPKEQHGDLPFDEPPQQTYKPVVNEDPF